MSHPRHYNKNDLPTICALIIIIAVYSAKNVFWAQIGPGGYKQAIHAKLSIHKKISLLTASNVGTSVFRMCLKNGYMCVKTAYLGPSVGPLC